MKKIIFIAVVITLVSCGSGVPATKPDTDSTKTVVKTTVDTTKKGSVVDSTKTK